VARSDGFTVMLSARAVFKFVWVLDRKIGRLGAFQDAIGEKAVGIDCRQTVTGGKGDDGVAMHNIEIFRQNQQSPALFAREPRRHRLDLGIVATRRGCHLKHSGFECLTGCNVSGSRSILVSAIACAPIAGGGQRRCRCSPCQSQGSSFISDSAAGWLKPSKKRAARRGDAGSATTHRKAS